MKNIIVLAVAFVLLLTGCGGLSYKQYMHQFLEKDYWTVVEWKGFPEATVPTPKGFVCIWGDDGHSSEQRLFFNKDSICISYNTGR